MSYLSFRIRYECYRIKYFFIHSIPWFIAMHIPKTIALYCFVRVYSIIDVTSEDYKNAYENWKFRHNLGPNI